MPCITREKSLLFRSWRDRINGRNVVAPKPVRPRAMRYHGLLGISLASQHLIVDEKWTPNSLTEQFTCLSDLLSRRVIYKRHESAASRRRLLGESKRLKLICSDGRTKLQKISTGNNAQKIRNYLINHKGMQRLYQKMPIHLVVDNINQRTFVLRKERDRLEFLLSQRKREYKNLLVERAEVENRIRYENEFVLEEELKSRILLKKIENSNVRLKAIRTINTTYKKMVQVLLQDEIFYEPILRSLDDDMLDQSNFIKHVLYMGMPAIGKFKELNKQFRHLEEKSRQNLQAKILLLSSLKRRSTHRGPVPVKEKREHSVAEDVKRYMRETRTMTKLKEQLSSVETTIKDLKLLSLCSQAKEIYPRIKNQLENNELLHRKIECDLLNNRMLETKMKCATVFQQVIVNNLSEEEINRFERIRDLKLMLKQDGDFEEETMDHIKNRADLYVMIRLSLWNLYEILRHVDCRPKMGRINYPNSYLKLPLLKFELLNVFAAPPAVFEEDIDKIMHVLKRKVYMLKKSYTAPTDEEIQYCKNEYHYEFLETLDVSENVNQRHQDVPVVEGNLLQDKTMANIPTRKQLKIQSARLVEEAYKRDEE